MQYGFLFLAVLFSVAVAAAQDLPQGPSPLDLGAHEAPLPAVEPAGAEPPTHVAAAASKVSFLMDAGVQYADEGEYAEAEQAYLRALETDPKNPDIRFRLSTLYIQMKQYAKAVELLEVLVAEFPDSPQTHNNLAWIYATGGELRSGKLALRHAREAILSDPYNPSLWNTLAEAYYVFGQYDKALRSSETAIDLLQQRNGTETEIASFREQHVKIQRAEAAYKQLLGLEE
jgi:tetratricopeptide (TPR) repeat protein